METKIDAHPNSNIFTDPLELLLTVHSTSLSEKELMMLTSLTAKGGMQGEDSSIELCWV